jgi:Uncharacterized protein SCO1/SenC/PrrC, involved in biogenesis of respiratory and photosynthetic systems
MYNLVNDDARFGGFYNQITTCYRGMLRDKLILHGFLMRENRYQDIADYYEKSLAVMGNNQYSAALRKGLRYNVGTDFYPFELPDARGDIIKLSDFRGKRLLIDFWFTQCIACKRMAKLLKPLKEEYKKDTTLVFMTINIDNQKDMWLRSLEKGDFGTKDAVNLYAGGMGHQHPLLKAYNMIGLPQLMLISANKGPMVILMIKPTGS